MMASVALGPATSLPRHDVTAAGVVAAVVLLVLIVAAICTVNALKLVGEPFPGFLVNERLAISNVGGYHWSGSVAGLRFPDKLLEVNGNPVGSPRDLERLVAAVPVGTSLTYAVQRDGETLTFDIPSMRFGWLDLTMTFGVTLLAGIFYITIGALVFALKINTRVSWVFFTACFHLSVYSITNFDLVSTQWGFIRGIMLAQAFLPAAFVHFGLLFPRTSSLVTRYPRIQVLPYIVSAALVLPMQYLYPDPRFLAFWYLILGYMVVGGAAVVLPVLREFLKPKSALARQRAKVVLFGAALALPLPALAYTSQTVFGSFLGMQIRGNLLLIPSLIFPASIAYSIVRHNLFDVDVYIKRAVGYVIMTVLVATLYFLLQSTLVAVTRPMLGTQADQVYAILLALVVVFFFNPINRRVQTTVDRVFFRQDFDFKDTVRAVEEALSALLSVDDTIERIVHTARERMFIDTAGLVVLHDNGGEPWTPVFQTDEPAPGEDPRAEVEISPADPLIELVRRERALITVYDIEENPRYRRVRGRCRKRFANWGISMAMPLVFQNEVIGVLLLGGKKSGKFYNTEDIELLQTLSAHGAAAIENAVLAEQKQREEFLRSNLSRYASPQIVEQIVSGNVAVNLDGERKLVTVLFSDIRGFTGITGSRPPNQLLRMLHEYFGEMGDVIFEHQGSVEQYVGDAIMAVFGSLVEIDRPAENAAHAAIGMMERMPKLFDRWREEYGFTLETGIGLTTGKVLFGNIGSRGRMELAVIGEPVVMASRFSGVAKGGQIIADRPTVESLGPRVRYNELPRTRVKGKDEEIEVFEILYRARGVRDVGGEEKG